jgi:ABC-2 type transport system permease protein
VLRLVVSWFPGSRVPLLTQLTGITGQVGQILSAIPLVRLLHGPGWTPTYLAAAALGVLAQAAWLGMATLLDAVAGDGAALPAGFWGELLATQARGVVLTVLAALAGLGALLGLALPKPELATAAGQLGMSAVIFLDLAPAHRLPWPAQALRAAVPSTYAADALAGAFRPHPHWATIAGELGACAAVAVLALAVAAVALRRAVRR